MGLLIILHCLSLSHYVINPQMAGGGRVITCIILGYLIFKGQNLAVPTGELTQDDGTRSCKL